MSRFSRKRCGGFTLVEVLTAGMILALSGAVLGTAVTQAMRSLTVARDYQRAAELLDQTLTEIDLFGPARMLAEGTNEGVFESPDDRFAWRAEIFSRLEGHLYDVIVEVSWRTPAGTQRSVRAQTRLNDPPESRPAELAWDEL